ncbi:unnamed protein product [Didymodactylos carnosus]|uniref:Uncharacterized protein n=1 Tax=Didymodactylos carnosus TaxID=1234261 RepID=A0A816D4H9_9BILA|nr:unnamed protein product [Didymodactylos carnosus]CAF4528314.1 unnamed protein product [Didymodactylos carnosus]
MDIDDYWNREISRYSDHLTIWLDRYICRPGEYTALKNRFQNVIQPLNTLNSEEAEVDEWTTTFLDPEMLNKLKDTVYCLKPFFEIHTCLEFIYENKDKKVFFISSGSMAKFIVPQIAELPQIHGIYILRDDISCYASDWAQEYSDYIDSMFDHEDDLLMRVTIDIAKYLEKKGDDYMRLSDNAKAHNCYTWAIKLILRTRDMGNINYRQMHELLMKKLDEAERNDEIMPMPDD